MEFIYLPPCWEWNDFTNTSLPLVCVHESNKTNRLFPKISFQSVKGSIHPNQDLYIFVLRLLDESYREDYLVLLLRSSASEILAAKGFFILFYGQQTGIHHWSWHGSLPLHDVVHFSGRCCCFFFYESTSCWQLQKASGKLIMTKQITLEKWSLNTHQITFLFET